MNTLSKILTLGSVLVLSLTAAGAAEPTKVSIGYPPATDFLPAYVSKEKSIFDKNNIDSNMATFHRRSFRAASRSA